MRSVNLLKVAAEEEILRYRCMLARQGRRAAFGASALLFGIIVLVLGEIAAWQALHLRFAPIATTLILLGINLIIAGIFGVLTPARRPTALNGKRCRSGARRSRPRAGRCRLRPSSPSGRRFCATGMITVRGEPMSRKAGPTALN